MKQILFKYTLKHRHHLLLWWFCFPLSQSYVKLTFVLSCEGISNLSFLLKGPSKPSHPCYSFGEIWNLIVWCIRRTYYGIGPLHISSSVCGTWTTLRTTHRNRKYLFTRYLTMFPLGMIGCPSSSLVKKSK